MSDNSIIEVDMNSHVLVPRRGNKSFAQKKNTSQYILLIMSTLRIVVMIDKMKRIDQ